jgi:hypothetical protein
MKKLLPILLTALAACTVAPVVPPAKPISPEMRHMLFDDALHSLPPRPVG